MCKELKNYYKLLSNEKREIKKKNAREYYHKKYKNILEKKEKIFCTYCQKTICVGSYPRHKKTQKHKKAVNEYEGLNDFIKYIL